MALFDAVTRPATSALTATERREINAAVRLNASPASVIFYQGSREVWDLGRDLPPLRLPHATMWIEWPVPRWMTHNGVPTDSGAREVRHACYVSEVPRAELVEPGSVQALSLRVFSGHERTGEHHAAKAAVVLHVDAAGQMVGAAPKLHYPPGVPREKPETESSLLESSTVALLALGLMSCRNVTLEGSTFRPRRAAGKNRKRVPILDYHTIVLPGYGSASGQRAKTASAMTVRPQHHVRGHFKTFTAERPLLGQHVGTFWWGWQVRGTKALGITVTDYAMASTP
jgi:hypothetical protein